MTLQKVQFHLTGIAPLLMHSGQTADPLNHYAKALKAVSGKRGKTDADFEEMAKIEWFAALYLEDNRVILPDFLLEAAFIAGSRKAKLGKQAEAGLFVDGHARLMFDGDNLTPEKLFERDQNRDCRAVRIQKNKVMRTRFIVKQWAATINVVFEDTMLNLSAIEKAISDCGSQVGLCDWRPKFGRFEAELLE